MAAHKKDWPLIVAGTAFATGLTMFFLFGVWFLPDAPSLLDLMRGFPVAVWLMALGFVMAIVVAGWRLMQLLRSPELRVGAPQAAPKAPVVKPVHVIVAGIILFVSGINVESGEMGLLTALGEFVVLIGIMLLVHRLESEK